MARPNRRFSGYTLFFDNQGQQKKWFVISSVALPFLFTIIFSIWGTVISIQSLNLSVETSRNREQLDTMKVMIEQMKRQNELLIRQNRLINTQVNQFSQLIVLDSSSNRVQSQHLSTYLGSLNEAKIPRLAIEGKDCELKSYYKGAEFAIFSRVSIVNYGGNIYKLKCKALDSVQIEETNIPANGSVPSLSNLDLLFVNPFLNTHKGKLQLLFSFEDDLHTTYTQDLILTKNEDCPDFHLGKMTSIPLKRPKIC